MSKILFISLILFLFTSNVKAQNQLTDKFNTNNDTSLIIVNVTIDGVELPFLFDTGSRFNLLFDDGNFNLESAQSVKALDSYNNQIEVKMIKKNIVIKSLKIKENSYCAVMEKRPDFLSELNIHGIIGANIINKYDWSIDFDNLQIARIKKTELKSIISDTSLFYIDTYFDEKEQSLNTFVNINNKKVPFLFDTGMNAIAVIGSKSDYSYENYLYKSYTEQHTIAGNYIDTNYIGVIGLSYKDFNIKNLPIEYSNKDLAHNSFGTKFLKPFGKCYIINSLSKMYFTYIDSFQFHFDNIKIKDGKIVNYIVPKNIESKFQIIGENIGNINVVKETFYLPKTLYKTLK